MGIRIEMQFLACVSLGIPVLRMRILNLYFALCFFVLFVFPGQNKHYIVNMVHRGSRTGYREKILHDRVIFRARAAKQLPISVAYDLNLLWPFPGL